MLENTILAAPSYAIERTGHEVTLSVKQYMCTQLYTLCMYTTMQTLENTDLYSMVWHGAPHHFSHMIKSAQVHYLRMNDMY